MNNRERVYTAFQHKEPDRTPVFEYVLLSPIADKLLGRKYAGDPANWDEFKKELGWKATVRQSAIDQLELALLLGHDMVYAIPNPSSSDAAKSAHEEPSDDPVEFIRHRTEIASAAPPMSDECLLVYSYLKEEMQKRGVDLPILAPAYAHGVWTDVELMQTMMLEPEVAHAHFAMATSRTLNLIDRYLALKIDLYGIGGDFSGTRPLISPEAYREFIVPEVRTLARKIHHANCFTVNASDGNLWPVINDFLFGCEVDGYLEIDMHAGMDLRKLKKEYGNKITFLGNLDCGNTLSFGTPEKVRTHTLECIEAGLGKGGHILCASNAITASVPMENYMAVVKAYSDKFNVIPPILRKAR